MREGATVITGGPAPTNRRDDVIGGPKDAAGSFTNAASIRIRRPATLFALAKQAAGGDAASVARFNQISMGALKLDKGAVGSFQDWHVILSLLDADTVQPKAVDFGAVLPGFQSSDGFDVVVGQAGTISATSSDSRFVVSGFSFDSGTPAIEIGPTGQITTKKAYVHFPGNASPDCKAGTKVTVGVDFLGDPNRTPGTYTGVVHVVTASGKTDVPVQARIAQGQLAAALNPSKALVVAGGSSTVNLRLSNTGAATTVKVNALALPAGVSLADPGAVPLAAGETKTVSLTLAVSADAPDGQNQPFKVRASTPSNQATADAGMSLDVYLPTYEWTQHIEGKFVSVDYTLAISFDGSWTWSGHLHDKSQWFGDYYSLVVGLPYKDPSTGKLIFRYVETDGHLGAKLSGPAVNADFVLSGKSQNLKSNFVFAVQHGPAYHLHTDGAPWPFIVEALQDAIAAAQKYGPEVASAASML